ncbi:MAG: Coq4 family protein [Chitinophagales bacterium]
MKFKTIEQKILKSIRAKWLVNLFEWSKIPYKFFCKQHVEVWSADKKSMQQMPIGTLGRSVGDFLARKGFELEPKLESHDICHVLLDYDTDVVSEIAMQYFLLASGKKSIYALGTCLIGFCIIPEYADLYFKAYVSGRDAKDFSQWNFEYLLQEDIDTLRSLIFSQPNENKLYI